MGKLEKRRALVTGSSSGIGAGVALAFAREGADVVVNYLGSTRRSQYPRRDVFEHLAHEVMSSIRCGS
jgi:NAD(P)-dependent dehydrogenase (short-subunit alcohol dehydrogenase family)